MPSRRKKDPYTCPACGYETERRNFMKNHLYNLKKPCPKTANDIDLTDDIKEYVLLNRKWHQKKPEMVVGTSSPYQIINNINQQNICVNNYIAAMDAIEKLNKYMNYTEKNLITYEERIENKYKTDVYKLENDKFKYGYELDRDALMNIMDEISQVSLENIEDMNIIYDDGGKRLKLYDGEWRSLRCKCAIKELLNAVKAVYLDKYELYLIKKIKNITKSSFDYQKLQEQLTEYYRFIACNDVYPCVKETSDLEEDVKEEYYNKYRKIYDGVTNGEKMRTNKEVSDIVTRNAKQNLNDLNKKLANLFKMDEEFKRAIMDMDEIHKSTGLLVGS